MDGTREPATPSIDGHHVFFPSVTARPSRAATHIARTGVPAPQCPGLEPTQFGSAPISSSSRARDNAGAPAPSTTAQHACHSAGPLAYTGGELVFELLVEGAVGTVDASPGATRRDPSSSASGLCENVASTEWSKPSARISADARDAMATREDTYAARSVSGAVCSNADRHIETGVSVVPHRAHHPGRAPTALTSAPDPMRRAAT